MRPYPPDRLRSCSPLYSYGATLPGMARTRLFRIRMLAGRSMLSAADDGTAPVTASSGEERVVNEKTAAFLVRHRAAEIIEVLDGQTVDDGEWAPLATVGRPGRAPVQGRSAHAKRDACAV